MYLRHTTVRKNGKTHTYWRLVRSVRTGRKVRQETVAQLGELDSDGRLRAKSLAQSIAGIEHQPGLFAEDLPAQPVRVDLRRLRLERGRRFGDVWLAWRLWQAIGLDALLEKLLPSGREDVPWSVHRPDCLQVTIGLVVTRDGYPLGYEVFAGNRSDVTTVQDIVERMEDRYGREGRIWALDRGMVSEANLRWLRERGSRYIVGTPKSRLKQYERELLGSSWTQIRDGLEVQSVPAEDGSEETFILCRSADRAAKERAMRERFEQRIESGLEQIQKACQTRRRAAGAIERRVGRLLGRNTRAAGLFDVRVTSGNNGFAQVTWSRKATALNSAQHREGCYLLRSM